MPIFNEKLVSIYLDSNFQLIRYDHQIRRLVLFFGWSIYSNLSIAPDFDIWVLWMCTIMDLQLSSMAIWIQPETHKHRLSIDREFIFELILILKSKIQPIGTITSTIDTYTRNWWFYFGGHSTNKISHHAFINF